MALYDRWPLTDGSGTTAANTVRSDNYGILVNSPTWITDSPNGGGLRFNGASGYWHCPNWYTSEPRYTGMNYVTTRRYCTAVWSTFVITAWFRVPEGMASGAPVWSFHRKVLDDATGQEPGQEWYLNVYRPVTQVYVTPDGYVRGFLFHTWLPEAGPPPYYEFNSWVSDRRVDDGMWHHVVVKRCSVDPRDYSAFLDGEKIFEATETVPTGMSEPYFHIGGVGWIERFGCEVQSIIPPGLDGIPTVPRSFYGDITDVRVYDSCESDSTIADFYKGYMPASAGAFSVSGGPTNILKPGNFAVAGSPALAGRSMIAGGAGFDVNGLPVRLIADIETPEPVLPAAVMFSCNT
jgi:hypothetical protein